MCFFSIKICGNSQAVESGVRPMEMGVGMGKNQTLICAPIMADTVDQMVELMHKAKFKGADIVEVRLDHLKSLDHRPDIEVLIRQCPLPTLFTYRFMIRCPLVNVCVIDVMTNWGCL